jgi:hypothetical protein
MIRGSPLDVALGVVWLALVIALVMIGGRAAVGRYARSARPTMPP